MIKSQLYYCDLEVPDYLGWFIYKKRENLFELVHQSYGNFEVHSEFNRLGVLYDSGCFVMLKIGEYSKMEEKLYADRKKLILGLSPDSKDYKTLQAINNIIPQQAMNEEELNDMAWEIHDALTVKDISFISQEDIMKLHTISSYIEKVHKMIKI